jgi:hypothetical protein
VEVVVHGGGEARAGVTPGVVRRSAGRQRAPGGVRPPQPLQALGRRGDGVVREVADAAVMRAQQVEPHGDGVVALEQRRQLHHVALRLRHLLAAERQHVPVHPHAGEGLAGRPRLGELALVVREHQVEAAAVDVELVPEVLRAHDRALEVPAGEALAPGAGPAHEVAGLGPLPEREVARVALVAAHLDPRALDLLVGIAPESSP